MGRRAEPDDLRAELDSAVVSIFRFMIQRNVNRHSGLYGDAAHRRREAAFKTGTATRQAPD